MSQANLETWHAHLRGEVEGGLDELLADDVVFYSPIVFTPQEGKELTKMYLNAAGATFSEGGKLNELNTEKADFKYTKEVVCGNEMVLEFETKLDGKYVNGVDIVTWNDEGKLLNSR